jgi:uncharacterized protein GlcG (DUF336 family)
MAAIEQARKDCCRVSATVVNRAGQVVVQLRGGQFQGDYRIAAKLK